MSILNVLSVRNNVETDWSGQRQHDQSRPGLDGFGPVAQPDVLKMRLCDVWQSLDPSLWGQVGDGELSD